MKFFGISPVQLPAGRVSEASLSPFGDKSPCRAAITTGAPLRVAPNEPNGWLPLRPLQSWGVAAEVAVRKAKRGMLGTGTMNSGGMKLNDQNWNEKVHKRHKSPNLYGNAMLSESNAIQEKAFYMV